MEKLKNLVNPGSKKDNEVMYGSGRSDDPVQTGDTYTGNSSTGSGQGSHFGSSPTAGHDPLSTSGNSTGTSQYDRGTTAGANQYGSGTTGGASHGLKEPYASRMPGGFDNDDAATTASVSSGVPGQSQSRSAMTGTNDPILTDKPLPREPASGTGLGQSSLTGNSYPDRTIGNSSRHGDHLGRDAALGAGAVGTSTHRHEDPQRDSYAPETGRSFPLGGSSATKGYESTTAGPHSSSLANKADPRVDSDGSRTTGNTGSGLTSGGYESTTAGPHSSNYANKADPRVDSDGSRSMGNTGYGSTSGGYESTTAGPHSSNYANKADPRVDSDSSRTIGNTGYGSTSGGYGSTTAGPHSSSLANKADPRVDSDGSRTIGNTGYGSTSGGYDSGNGTTPSLGNQGSVGRDTLGAGAGAEAGALRSGTTTNTGYGPESWQHEHQQHGHQYGGDPCESGEIGGQVGPHFVSGPHLTDTANRLDPHVSNADTTSNLSGHHQHGHHGHRGEAAALAGGAGTAGARASEAERSKQGTIGDTTSSGNTGRHGLDTSQGSAYDNDRGTATGVSSTGKTAGPHNSDMLNKLDPRVDSDLSKQQTSRSGDHHQGRDAALTAAGGAGIYEAERHHGKESDRATSSTTSGMGGSQGREHHIGRDTALTGAGAAGLYEADKHHRSNETNQKTSSTTSGVGGPSLQASRNDPRVDSTRSGNVRDESALFSAGSGHQPATTSDHHYKRDTGLAGAGGLGAYEAGKHLGSHKHSDLTASPQDQLAGSGHQPAIATSSSPDPSSGYRGGQHHTGHHNATEPLAAGGLGTGAGVGTGAGALAGHGHPQRDATGHGNEPYQDASRSHHIGRDAAAVGATGAGAGALASHEYSQRDAVGYGTEPHHETSRGNHTGRDAAILGGAAGAGGLAEHEHSKKDAERLQKEHAREEKALEKEHSKEVKHHNKERAKEERHHEKAIEKAEKKHETAVVQDERKYEKAMGKDEKKQEHGEKKHGGLLGFLHRDKPDKELKEEEARRQAAAHPGRGEEEMAAGAGAIGLGSSGGYDALHGEHGSQSGVHDSPVGIGSGPTTHDAYDAQDSGHNKLHKDPPAKVLESRGY